MMMPMLLLAAAIVAAPARPSNSAIGVASLDVSRDTRSIVATATVGTVPSARDWPSDTDPADSLMRIANAALAKGDYRRAVDLFRNIRARFPKSARLGEAMYFESFALYRTGEARNLDRALATLDELRAKYPAAAARGDAKSLRTRVCGELAQGGDARCAEDITNSAAAAADERARPERAERAERAERPERAERGTGRTIRAGDCPRDDDDDERIAAMNALLQMDADRAMPILTKIIARRDKCSEVLRKKAVFLISQKQSAETADLLLKIAQGDPDAEVREQAVFWLSQVRDERAVGMLGDILKSNTDANLKEKAIFAISQHRSEKASAMLRGFAERDAEPTELREKAIFWLGQQRSEENAEYLRALYGRLKNDDLKEKVIFSLSQQRGFGNETWLTNIAVNAKEPIELRKKALFWAGQDKGALPQLITMYGQIGDREMREQLIFVYSQRREGTAVDKLMEIAKSDKDRELRKKAIFWLGQSRDPRAASFLLELIDR